MKNYFIFQYEDLVSSASRLKVTVVFIHQSKIHSQNALAQELNVFFQQNSVTDKLIIISPEYLDDASVEYFQSSRDITFARVPGKSPDYFDNCLIIYKFDTKGKFIRIQGTAPENEGKFIEQLLRSGSTIIFKNNGGLVESTPDHHFVFPSNKHCSKFIRTGNVLIHQCEIFFLAVQLLKHAIDKDVIYCDTSSISLLPYCVFELKRRFGLQFEGPTVYSFESYEVFETSKDSFPPDALILISSSTSGNIVDRLLTEKRAEKEQIQLIYFLGPNEKYLNHKGNIVCNLTKDNTFSIGEEEFDTFSIPDDCKLCRDKHSRPIKIRSDVFLTIQPKITSHLLTVKPDYAPKNISTFVFNYRSKLSKEGIIKVYYKENTGDANYEIYFDILYLLENIDKFERFKESLNRNIDKHIPANTKYLLYLPDSGSEQLVHYILSKIPLGVSPMPIRLEKDFIEKIQADNGTVVIVASCISTGKKLLQISRLMRSKENLNLVYFVGIFRPIDDNFSNDLKNDLKRGKNKSDDRPFVAVETINCSIQQKDTSWDLEKLYFEELLGSLDEEKNAQLFSLINKRLDTLRDNKRMRGFSDNLTLVNPKSKMLMLRRNFAFWDFDYDEKEVGQSEVYFTISTILRNLEARPINSFPSLKQTNYVRNLLSPRNFHRFNDGIIQASLLRSGRTEYFAYDLDNDLSLQMKEFLVSIIEKYDTEDGEALLEFLLALGMKRLKLTNEDLKEVLAKAMACSDPVIKDFATCIANNLL
ncbi:MAG: hypothetical protein KF746_21355 [Chitinophagaceae bacterium]|nr:hypothetical protein [Chitinophagaceae bacterium]